MVCRSHEKWAEGICLSISDLLRDSLGHLYGTTNVGGDAESGTVFESAP
jgi:hypothetical protein